MDLENLVTMANQIGSFFETMPDRNKALAGIADHIKKYWEPRMRRALLNYIDTQGESQLKPIVLESILLNRDLLAV